jgi:hypothetical protein
MLYNITYHYFSFQYYGKHIKYKLFNVMNKDLQTIEVQILELLSKYLRWDETELFERRGENNQVCIS